MPVPTSLYLAAAAATGPEPLVPPDALFEAWHPQQSGLFDHDCAGESLQKLEHMHPEALLPRHAALWNFEGTKWHQEGFAFAVNCWGAKKAIALREPLATPGADCEAWHPQHSGLFCHESAEVSLQKFEHMHPEALLPRQAALWYCVGTKWHQEGIALAANSWEARNAVARPEPRASPVNCETSHAQHPGLFDHDPIAMSAQKLEHVQP